MKAVVHELVATCHDFQLHLACDVELKGEIERFSDCRADHGKRVVPVDEGLVRSELLVDVAVVEVEVAADVSGVLVERHRRFAQRK